MPTRTVILILILTALTAVLVVLAIRNESQQKKEIGQPTQIVDQAPEKTAFLTFVPEQVTLTSSGSARTATVDLFVDTKEYSADGVQIELLYDPEVLSDVEILTPTENLFGGPGDSVNILNTVDADRGRVSYGLGISPVLTGKQGTGVVAQLTFSLNPQSTATQTAIEVLDRSTIIDSKTHMSVLATPTPLSISIVR